MSSARGDREAIRGGLLHFDCASGIAGDMAVGALVDLGVPESAVREALAALPLAGYSISFTRVRRGALQGTRFAVAVAGEASAGQPGHEHPDQPGQEREHAHAQPHRHYREIRRLIESAPLAARVRERAVAIFERIAVVEGRLHGVAPAEVAFHEVGAVDSIVDVVATAAAIEWLAPSRITSRPVPLGHGSVATAHGLLPLPAPATLELLEGAPVEDGGAPFELTTPTGAAILAASVQGWGFLPAMKVGRVGWGAGERDLPDRPNLLRVVAGRSSTAQPQAAGERCVVIEANIDDLTPELLAPLVSDLLAAGARDAWVTPALMKKARPGWTVSALCDPDRTGDVERALFRGSSTIGVRRHAVERTVLARRLVEVQTPFGAVRIKLSGDGESENVAPELEDCARLAREHGVPLKRVHAEALSAWFRGPRVAP